MTRKLLPSQARAAEPSRPFITYENQPDPNKPGETILTAIANIPVPSGGEPVQCEADQWDALMRAGFSDRWYMHSNGHGWSYARTCHPTRPRKPVMPARFIAEIGEGRHIRYLDGNSRNLRRSNLGTCEGFARTDERALGDMSEDGDF